METASVLQNKNEQRRFKHLISNTFEAKSYLWPNG